MKESTLIILVLLLILAGTINLGSYIILINEGYVFNMCMIFFISLIITYLIIYQIGYLYNKELKEIETYIKESKKIAEYGYKKETWENFASKVIRKKITDFMKYYIPSVLFCLCLLYFIYTEKKLFFLFLYIFSSILIPISISNIIRFKNKINTYFKYNNEPNITIFTRGIVINDELEHCFINHTVNTQFHNIEKVILKNIDCFKISTIHKNNKGGAHFKSTYVPIDFNDDNQNQNLIKYLQKLTANKV